MKRFSLFVAAASFALATAAMAQPDGEIKDPVWRQRPSASELMSFYPMEAMRNEKTGVSVARCVAKADGSLTKCESICESPGGYGFAKAARLAASRHKLQPTLADGGSVEGRTVTLPFHFNPQWLPPVPRCDQAG